MNRTFKLFFAAFFWCSFFFGLSVNGQNLDNVRKTFPHDDVAFLNISNHYTIVNNDGKLKVKDEVEETTAYLTANDMRAANDAIFYSSFSVIKNLDAYTESPTGKGKHLKDMSVGKFDTRSAMTGDFYDDYKKITFTYPGVTSGAITHLNYTEEYLDPRMVDVFYFNSYIPVVNAELKVTFPETVKLAYSLFGDDTSMVKFTSSKSGKLITYTWTAKNMPSLSIEPNSPNRSYFDPHIIFRISSYESEGKETPLLDNPASLYKWYTTLVKDVNKTDEAEVKNLVAKITNGLSSDREKAKAIYQWVQGNINYIAFEDGMGGFVPRDAGNVYRNKYGDCKDMANLLRQMLQYAGLNASLAWIGTRNRPYTYEKVPTPMVDNHVIVLLGLDGKNIFLDATGKYIPFGLPSPMIQGKEALVGISDKDFKINKVPEVPKEVNIRFDSTQVKVNGRDLDGSGHTHLSGFEKLTFDYLYYGSHEKQDKDFFGNYLNKGSNKFALKDSKVSGLSDPDKETDITYQYSVPDYVKSSGNKLYINLNLDKPLKDEQLDIDKRQHAREFEYKFVQEDKLVLSVPDGYSVEYIPEAANFDNKDYGFNASYHREGDKIIFDKKVYINTLFINKDGFKDWNDYIGQLNKAYKETIVLSKTQP